MTISTTQTRRYDLDWLRIIAFGLLIFYHIGMFYVTWDWHVKSDHASHAIEPLMLLVNPWRLELLFFISGVATRFMADKMSPLALAGSRFNRLFWPLAFGMLVIVPPQSYLEIVSDLHYAGGFIDFYSKYLTHYKGWCDQNGCLIVPTWNHLWYVAYLLVYCLIFALIWPILKRIPLGFLKRLPAFVYAVVPIIVFWASRVILQPVFDETHALVDDWYVHAVSFGFFLAGAAVARFDRFFEIARKSRVLSLCLGLTAYGVLVLAKLGLVGGDLDETTGMIIGKALQSAQAIFMIMALLGFARQHLSHADGLLRRTLTEAVFPAYIAHQTIIVVAAYTLNTLHMPVLLEAGLLIAITTGGCALTYLIVSRLPALRPLFGLPFKIRPDDTAKSDTIR